MPAEQTTEAEVAQLEKRATSAEKQLQALKAKLESGVGAAAGNADLEARLRELLQLMYEDREECETIRAQRDELREENARLRAQVAKGEYRIKHLLRTIDEIEKPASH
jgi:chromosome segregation ATPase